MTFLIHSPLEQFEVTSLISLNLPVLGYINLSLTNLGLYTILTVYLVLALHIMGSNNKQLIPSRWSISLESSFASVLRPILTIIDVATVNPYGTLPLRFAIRIKKNRE